MNDRSDTAGAGEADDNRTHVVTAFLRNRGKLLVLRRSDAVGTYRGQWGGVSGFAEGDPDGQVRIEIREETGLTDADVSLVRTGRPLAVSDDGAREWVVHPYLFDADTRTIDLSEEHDATAWVSPTAMLSSVHPEDDRPIDETVPKLWATYERVAPTVRSIAADDDHGAAYLSIRALEVIRDRAGLLVAERAEYGTDPAGECAELAELASRLLEVRPAMAVLRNRVNRSMAEAAQDRDTDPDGEFGAPAVLEATLEGIDRAVDADTEAARNAADRLEGTILTLSRSGTVLEALEAGDPSRVYVAESRPAGEGLEVAETLIDELDCPVTVHTDAAVPAVIAREGVDRLVVGADTILPDGRVVNKTGTRSAAIAAAYEGVPVTVVAATDKCSTRETVNLEAGSQEAIYDGDATLDVLNPTFDVTPADCVHEIVTEDGSLEPAEISGFVERLRALEGWETADGR